jgi:hypothetical protein
MKKNIVVKQLQLPQELVLCRYLFYTVEQINTS